jgi:two-component system OmpR family sensor kinase
MARIGSERSLKTAAFELAPMLAQCAALLDYPVELEVAATTGSVTGDRRLLMRAVGNVLRNAEKYAKSRIILSARSTGPALEIAVEDDGPGVPEAERERIFEPFYRLDRSRDRATGGFGLGLSIARKAVEVHGGTIRVESPAAGGARVVIALPAVSAGA